MAFGMYGLRLDIGTHCHPDNCVVGLGLGHMSDVVLVTFLSGSLHDHTTEAGPKCTEIDRFQR